MHWYILECREKRKEKEVVCKPLRNSVNASIYCISDFSVHIYVYNTYTEKNILHITKLESYCLSHLNKNINVSD